MVSTAVLWGSARAAAAGTSVPVPTWRRVKKVGTIVTFSWLMAVPVWCAILASLGVLDWHGAPQRFERTVYGIFRCLFLDAWPGARTALPMCTSSVGSPDAPAPDIDQRVALAIPGRSPR